MTTDRHKEPPQAVRMPDGLKAWYREQATAEGQPLNALLVAALEEFRARHDGATTPPAPATRGATAPRKPRQPKAAPVVTFTVPLDSPNARIALGADPDCPHPKARINKGLCGACGTNVGTREGQ